MQTANFERPPPPPPPPRSLKSVLVLLAQILGLIGPPKKRVNFDLFNKICTQGKWGLREAFNQNSLIQLFNHQWGYTHSALSALAQWRTLCTISCSFENLLFLCWNISIGKDRCLLLLFEIEYVKITGSNSVQYKPCLVFSFCINVCLSSYCVPIGFLYFSFFARRKIVLRNGLWSWRRQLK